MFNFINIFILLIVISVCAFAQEGVDEHKCGTMNVEWSQSWGKFVSGSITGRMADSYFHNGLITVGTIPKMEITTTLKDNEQDSINVALYISYITKHDTDGNLLWSTIFAAYEKTTAKFVDVDSKGNIVILGYASSDASSSATSKDIGFILRLDSNGNRLDYKSFPKHYRMEYLDFQLINDSRFVVTGKARAKILVDGTFKEIEPQREFPYLACYDMSGKINWVKNIDSSVEGSSVSKSLDVDSVGNVFIAGETANANFYTNREHTATLEKFDVTDIFIRKYTIDGSLQWSTMIGGASFEYVDNIKCSPNSGVLLSARYFTSNDDTLSVTIESKPPFQWDQIYVMYDEEGNIEWSRYAEKYDSKNGWGIAFDSENNIYCALYWNNSKGYNPQMNNLDSCQILTSANAELCRAMIIIKYDANGIEQYFYTLKPEIASAHNLFINSKDDLFVPSVTKGYDFTIGSTETGEFQNGMIKLVIDKIDVFYSADEFMCEGESFRGTLTSSDEDIEIREAEVWVEISDEFGSFSSPISISNTFTEYGEVLCTIPENLASGVNYRIRTSSSDDEVDYGYATTRIKLKQLPDDAISGEEKVCHNEVAKYEISPIQDIAYSWIVIGGKIIGDSENNKLTVEWNDEKNGFVTLNQLDTEYGCSNTIGFPVDIQTSVNFEYTEQIGTCENGDELQLNHIIPSGGIYTGAGIENNTLKPSELESGTYSLTYTIDGECTEISEFIYIIHSQPSSPTITLDGVIMSVASDLEVFWYRLPDEENPVATGKTYVPTEEGDYGAKVSSEESCLSELSNIITPPLSISDEIEKYVIITLEDDILLVQSKAKYFLGEIIIYDIQGKIIFSSSFESRLQIDMSPFAEGNYILELKGKETQHYIFNK